MPITVLLAALTVPPPPPPPGGRTMVAWQPGTVRCDAGVQSAIVVRRPFTALGWGANVLKPITVHFAIDAAGRSHAITRDGTGYVFGSDDIEPALAATRFAAGSERGGCSVTFTATQVPIAAAPIPDLISYSLNPTNGTLPREGWDRISGGAPCVAEPRPALLLQAFPDFRAIAGTPGVRDWSMIGYDLDPRGRPIHVQLVTGTGNAALDRASADAVTRSRFTGGARTGCRYPYWKMPDPMPAPAEIDMAKFVPQGSTCPYGATWTNQPTLIFPEAFRRRSIEGWAVIGFDVAPWGATGNIKVLAAEPAAGFGEAAANVIRGATRAPSTAGAVGCVERVRFVMGTPKRPAPIDPEAPPPIY